VLDGIEPDLSESHWPEYDTKEDLRRLLRLKNLKAVYVALGHSRLYIIMKNVEKIYKKLKSFFIKQHCF